MISLDVRQRLVEALRLDLVGPEPGSALEAEVLAQAPSRWYLTGLLVPLEAGEAQRSDEAADDEIDHAGDAEGVDDDTPPEPSSAKRAFFPSSMGLSLLVPGKASTLTAVVRWGDYQPEGERALALLKDAGILTGLASETTGSPVPEAPPESEAGHDPDDPTALNWRRHPREVEVTIPLPDRTEHPKE